MKLLGSSELFETLTVKNKNYQKLCCKMDQTILQLREKLNKHSELLFRVKTELINHELLPELTQEIQVLISSKLNI